MPAVIACVRQSRAEPGENLDPIDHGSGRPRCWSHLHPWADLQNGRKSRNIYGGSGVIWGIPADMEKDEWLEGIGVPRHLLARRVAQVPTTGTAGTHPAARHAPATPAPPPPDLIGIDITLPAPLEPSGQQQLTATGRFSDDSTQDLAKTVKWSADRDIVSVDAHGLAKAARGAAGKVKITATPASSNVSGQITVTIRLALQEIIVTPQNPLIEISQSRGLTATAVYADGEKEDITPKVDWQTSQPKVADFRGLAGAMVSRPERRSCRPSMPSAR